MTIFRAPLANNKGEVMLSMQATGVVPAGAVPFRGLWVTINGLVCATNDTGQARKYVGGFALEDPSGLLLVTETAPASVPMDGINANAAGAVVTKEGAASLIHQGVAMTVSAPGGPLVVNKDEPPLTFLAPLEHGVNSAAIEAVGTRDSEATYWTEDGTLRIAGVNEIRQEFQNGQPIGTLMEPAITNKCTVNNANPDAALTGYSTTGDAQGVLSRVYRPDLIEASGLQHVCPSGWLLELDNTAGSAYFGCIAAGQAGNTNVHSGSAYMFLAEGTGTIEIGLTDDGVPEVPITPDPNKLIRNSISTAAATNSRTVVWAKGGQKVYAILHQLEEHPAPTSVILTVGSAASRAKDELKWSLTDSLGRNIFNQAQGMVAFVWRPGTDKSAWNSGLRAILSLNLASLNLMFLNKDVGVFELRSSDGTTSAIRAFPGNDIVPGQDYVLAARWGNGTFQTGIKTAGAWLWSTTPAYDGDYSIATDLHLISTLDTKSHSRQLELWSEDEGTAWLESHYTGVAN